MPPRIDPNRRGQGRALTEEQYDYKYPNNLKLHPDSSLHRRLVDEIMARARESKEQISKRYDSWNQIDETLTAYMYVNDLEAKEKLKDPRKPIAVVVPISYATIETLLTYLVAAFLNDPIFAYEGRGPEDVTGAALMEMVVNSQVQRNKVGLALHTLWRDSLAYGIGVASPIWKVTSGYKTIEDSLSASSFTSLLARLVGRGGSMKKRIPTILYEGNSLETIDPYKYFPDPSVSVDKIQDGEYIGWMVRESYMSLLSEEQTDPTLFNVRYVRKINGLSTMYGQDESRRERVSGMTSPATSQPVDIMYMYINLIPSEWKLGKGTTPEKWLFALAGDQIIIRAQPLNLDHNMFPVVACSPDYDGHTATPISRLEIIHGLQQTIDFYYNSRLTNVRKSLNDMFVVDPELININDMLNPQGGLIIRLRQKAWGRGVQNAVEQLRVNDVTAGHMQDSLFISDIVQKVSAATDSLAGIAHYTGERRSAEEMRGVRNSALSRLEKSARIASLMCMNDLGYMFASQTQQLLSLEQYYKITGKWIDAFADEREDRVFVTPKDILVDYDLVIQDGSIPSSGDSQQWVQMMQVIATQPSLLQSFDIVKIFKHWARMSGAKNVSDFQLRGQVTPDEQVMKQVQEGNLVPIIGGK